MFNRFFNSQAKTINTAALILAASAALSRLLGVVRDSLLYRTFGAGKELDVYFAAFRIPDFVYNVLIAGGVVVAFLPLFSEYFMKSKEEAWRFANNVLNVFLVFLVAASLVGVIFAPFLIKLITPGFDQEQLSLTILLSRLLFLSPILLGLSSLFSGILQYFNKFLAYGLAPIFYSLGIILGIIFLAPTSGILGVVLGVILGALLHFLVQLPSALGSGFRYRPLFNLHDLGIKKVFYLMFARTFGVAAPQISLMVVTAIASVLPAGALSVFSFSNNLQQVPLGLVGIPFAMAAFPGLSKAAAALQRTEFINTWRRTFLKILCLIVPLSLLIFILRNQIVNVIYHYGQVGQDSSLGLIGASLGLFSLGISAACLIPLTLRAFFALKDTKTPTIIAIVAMILNIFLSFSFVRLLGYDNPFHNFIVNLLGLQEAGDVAVLGLPLAFSLDIILQWLFLVLFLKRKIKKSL
jgi:putative peptidoglycan lipid II flippase